jgi:hypothetical protein
MYLLALQQLPHLIWSQRVDVSVLERNWARSAWNDQKPLERILKYVRRIGHEREAEQILRRERYLNMKVKHGWPSI